MTAPITNGFQIEVNWEEVLTGQFLLFGLLGKLLYSHPEVGELAPLVEEEIFEETPFAATQPDVTAGLRLLRQWSRAFAAAPEETTGDVQSDYTRLFMGVAQLPVAPWESVYYSDERLLFEESTLHVRRWYRRYGMQAINLHREPDDHIGLELLFLAHLARMGITALQQNDEKGLIAALEGQRGFSREHLLVWVPTWCNVMLEHARTDYYRGLALLVRGALQEVESLLASGF